jgi:hypothetical protein
METESVRTSSNQALVDTGEAMPLPRRPSSRNQSLRSEARRRRTLANIMVVCSSVVAIAVVGICYALLAG